MAATPQKSFFIYMNIVCYLHTLPPSVEKTQRGILIKAGRNLVSFIHADDESRQKPIFSNL